MALAAAGVDKVRAEYMVRWYRQAFRGTCFRKPGTLLEFKRIQVMAGVIVPVVPLDTIAYAKGDSIEWAGFHCFCLPGQMIVGKLPVTFCFTINWTGPDDGVGAIFKSYVGAVADVLGEAAQAVG